MWGRIPSGSRCRELGLIMGGFFGIESRRCLERLDLIIIQRTNRRCRRTDDEASRREDLAFGYERPCSDNGLAADHGAIQDSSAHPDQRFVFNGAAVKDRLMADGHPRSDGERRAWIAVPNRPVLEIGFLTENDRRVVGADDRAKPDTRAGAQANIANQVGARRDPSPRIELRCNAIEIVKRHDTDI